MKKKKKTEILLNLSLVLSIILMIGSFNLPLNTENNINDKIFNIRTSDLDFTNATVISDGHNNIIWNDGISWYPDITLDHLGNIHAVWSDDTVGIWGSDDEIVYSYYSASTGWSLPTVISDGYMGVYWNNDWSGTPDIAIDSSGGIHVVWKDFTDGIWGIDTEIMYVSYTEATGWSNVTVISDGYSNIYWNNDNSGHPAINIDNNDKIHVVWDDLSDGVWGYDTEIMYASYTEVTGWSNATIVSDGYSNVYWNNAESYNPAITTDNNGKIHVVWEDGTDGIWGSDWEIMYVSYTEATGWSNASVISDGHNNIYWNNDESATPDIAIDSSGNTHVVWEDDTDGAWGSDREIMYVSYTEATSWSIPIVISDGYNNIFWNTGASLAPSIAIEPTDAIYVVWEDDTDSVWGIDEEIMCTYYVGGDGWSNATVISDGASGIYWNDGFSQTVSIVADLNNVHVVWEDETNGIWGSDREIMYTSIKIALPPDNFALSSNAESPDDDGSFDLLWTESLRAINYSVYQHSNYITDINISLTLVDEGLTNILLNLSEYESGPYYFIVEAFNDYGSTLSNNVFVEVQIPSDVIPFGNFYLVFSFTTILGLAIYIRKKSKF